MAHTIFRPLQRTSKTIFLLHHKNKIKPIINTQNNSRYYTSKRPLITETWEDAFQSKLLRLLRHQIHHQLETYPPSKPVTKFNSFDVDEQPTKKWIKLTRKFNENEEIKLEVSMFDASLPIRKLGADEDDVLMHASMLVSISKGEENNVLEFACSVWPDSIEVHKVYTSKEKRTAQLYMGPGFKDLDDDFQDSLYDYLEERGIGEELATFIHEYMKNKETSEYIRCMETVKSFIVRKEE